MKAIVRVTLALLMVGGTAWAQDNDKGVESDTVRSTMNSPSRSGKKSDPRYLHKGFNIGLGVGPGIVLQNQENKTEIQGDRISGLTLGFVLFPKTYFGGLAKVPGIGFSGHLEYYSGSLEREPYFGNDKYQVFLINGNVSYTVYENIVLLAGLALPGFALEYQWQGLSFDGKISPQAGVSYSHPIGLGVTLMTGQYSFDINFGDKDLDRENKQTLGELELALTRLIVSYTF